MPSRHPGLVLCAPEFLRRRDFLLFAGSGFIAPCLFYRSDGRCEAPAPPYHNRNVYKSCFCVYFSRACQRRQGRATAGFDSCSGWSAEKGEGENQAHCSPCSVARNSEITPGVGFPPLGVGRQSTVGRLSSRVDEIQRGQRDRNTRTRVVAMAKGNDTRLDGRGVPGRCRGGKWKGHGNRIRGMIRQTT